jgi:flagellar basal-body rod modification protein FlgD
MFLNLLVAQIQNQDPLNPTDSAQFVSQLTQISELEQTIGIRSDIETYMGSQSSSSQTGDTSGQANNTSTQTTSTGQNTPAGTSIL